MNAVILKNNINIENLIYEVRGVQVMLDSDLARLYECTNRTKDINKAVKRNLERFPENFMFRLTDEEYNALRFQIGTSNIKGGRRYNPYVFTEQGVAMLSSVLHSETAINMSIKIINAFVMMRKYVSTNILEQKYINNMVLEDHDKIRALEDSFQKFEEKRKTTEIYFNGQIYDAYSKIQEIFNSAKNELIIIDGYADNTMLDIVKRLKIKVTIITKPNNLLTLQDIEKYNKQYNNLTVIYDNTFHDRCFIIDEKIVYHCGASINRIGYKTFSITLIGDSDVKEALLKKVNKRQEEKNMNFIIKEGNINDINEVVDAIKYLHDIIENKEWYAIGLADYDKILDKLNDDAIIVKALYKDDLAGFLLAERHINPNGELAEEIPKDELSSSIEMDNAGVLPKYRGNHLQEHLILKAESIMKERDSSIKYSYETVHPDNLPSLKTLEKAGYKKYKEKLMYGGKIRYIMRKELI